MSDLLPPRTCARCHQGRSRAAGVSSLLRPGTWSRGSRVPGSVADGPPCPCASLSGRLKHHNRHPESSYMQELQRRFTRFSPPSSSSSSSSSSLLQGSVSSAGARALRSLDGTLTFTPETDHWDVFPTTELLQLWNKESTAFTLTFFTQVHTEILENLSKSTVFYFDYIWI